MKVEQIQDQKRVAYKDMHTFYLSVDEKQIPKVEQEPKEDAKLNRNIDKTQRPIDPDDKDTVEV